MQRNVTTTYGTMSLLMSDSNQQNAYPELSSHEQKSHIDIPTLPVVSDPISYYLYPIFLLGSAISVIAGDHSKLNDIKSPSLPLSTQDMRESALREKKFR